MSGSSNFEPWGGNTGPGSNIESDATYLTDSLRTGGIPTNAILPSVMLNKLFLQATMMVAALGQMMATKGYTVSDANLNTLAAVLANIVTQFDLANSPALGGNPTSTTQGTGDNSTHIATTAFAQALIAFILGNSPALGGNPTTPTQGTGDNSTHIASTAFVKSVLPAVQSIAGGLRIGGFQVQMGGVNVGAGGTIINFPTPFPNACLIVLASPAGSAPSTVGVVTFGNSFWEGVGPAGVVACNYLAVGF